MSNVWLNCLAILFIFVVPIAVGAFCQSWRATFILLGGIIVGAGSATGGALAKILADPVVILLVSGIAVAVHAARSRWRLWVERGAWITIGLAILFGAERLSRGIDDWGAEHSSMHPGTAELWETPHLS
jgi:hypothetical protein